MLWGLVFLVSHGLATAAWAAWDGHDCQVSVADGTYNRAMGGRLCFWTIAAVLLGLHLLLVLPALVPAALATPAVIASLAGLAAAVALSEWMHRRWLARRLARETAAPPPDFNLPATG
jgi:hypothetical protein